MKRSLITFGILFSLCLSMGLFTACSTEEEQAQPQQNLVNLAAKGKIILSMQDFNAEREITRAVQAPTDTQVVDLDNGMTAEISVERGQKRKTAVTRAHDIYSGHFNLYALNPATNLRVGNVLRGTIGWVTKPTPSNPWAGEYTFIPDAGSLLVLAPGTYKFVCYNDAVEDDGTNLTIKNFNNPLIGSTTATIPANSIEYKVDIEMKHPAVRCQVSMQNLIGSGEPTAGFANMKGRLIATTTKAIRYSADLTSKTVIPGTDILEFPLEGYGTGVSTTSYLYVLPGDGTDMKLEFYNGTCYYNSVGTLKTSLTKLGTMSANDDYKLNIKITPSYKYLFNDGTTGYLRDKGTRTPIGIVVRRKTAGEKGLAVALNLASTSQERPFTDGYDHISWVRIVYTNKRVFSTLTDAFTDMDGYAYTWDANTSSNNEVKAGSDKYPAFKLAANYNPGVPTSGIGRWFLPSLGQIKLMMATIGFSRKSMSNGTMQAWASAALAYGFSKAGASNSPITADKSFLPICSSTCQQDADFWSYGANYVNGFYNTYNYSAYVLPFVEF
ncbi:hypothetical protein [Prevotella sp. HJM029]|uniref:hypothetical protein n=1 Tax=Prevotella sp. HJM029 TaxID=1433844 RepID=UPI0004BC1F10|nr:hypothetical protein [Prevotella sp. HJM029]